MRKFQPVALSVIVLLFGVAVGYFLAGGKRGAAPATEAPVAADAGEADAALRAEAEAIRARLPLEVAADTRLDAVDVAGRQVSYSYTLLLVDSTMIDRKAFVSRARRTLAETACGNPGIVKLLASGYTYRYQYRDKNDVAITTIDIGKSDCP